MRKFVNHFQEKINCLFILVRVSQLRYLFIFSFFYAITEIGIESTANMRKLISLFMFIVQSLKLFDKRGTCFRIESFKQYVYVKQVGK